MKRSMRWFALMLALVMMLSACGQKVIDPTQGDKQTQGATDAPAKETEKATEKATEENKESVQIRIANVDLDKTPNDDIYMTQILEKEFNIDIIWEEYSSDAWNTELALMFTTGELPDMIVGSNMDKNASNEYGDDGYFLDMMEYIEYMPNVKKYFDLYPNFANYSKTSDGELYGLARVFPSRLGVASIMNTWINTEWLERVGMDEPTSLDELYKVLKAFKEQDANGNGDPNDEIPLGMQLDCGRGFRLQYLILAAHGYYVNEQGWNLYLSEDGKVGLAPLEENYREYLRYMHKLHDEKLMEQSVFDISNEERIDKTAKDIYGVFSDYSGLVTALGGAVEGNPYEKYALIGGLSSDYTNGERYHIWGNAGYASKARTFVNADTEYPEICCQLIDYFFADENQITVWYGEEGVTYEYVDDAYGNKVPVYKEGWNSANVTFNEGFNLVRTDAKNSIVENADDATLEEMIKDPAMVYSSQAQIEQEWRSMDEVKYPFPDMVIPEEDNDRYLVLKTDLTNLINTYEAAFILGEKDLDKDWDQYQKDLAAAGAQELLDIVQKAYNIYAGK